MLHGCRLGLRQDFSKVDERRCRDSWWWSPQLGEEAKERCTAKLGKRAVRSYHVGHEIFGIQSELMDLGYSCSLIVATDSQSVIDHSKRRGHTVASKHVGLRGLWLHEALVDGKLELEKADTAIALLTCVPKRCLETASACCVGDDPNEWYRVGCMSCADLRNSNGAATLSLKGVLISHVSFVVIRLISHLQLDMSQSIPNVHRVLSWRRVHVNSMWTCFNPVVKFVDIRVFQACTCDQR